MGIKTVVTQDELPLKYKEFDLIETQDGVTHSVYLLGNKYVLKIVENTTLDTILAEQNLLENIKTLCVPTLLDIYEKEKYTMVFYSQMNGKSASTIELFHIKQIATFLKYFHNISKHISSTNTKIYETKYLENLITKTNEPKFLKYFNTINCKLNNDGVIHGDLFCDNAKFKDDTLSGVFDFIDACEGDFIFELAVVSISWCFEDAILNEEKTLMLLDTYGLDIKYSEFKEYIKYALLHYATIRYLDNRNYKELLRKLDIL
jgi:homoserine kinase type II